MGQIIRILDELIASLLQIELLTVVEVEILHHLVVFDQLANIVVGVTDHHTVTVKVFIEFLLVSLDC